MSDKFTVEIISPDRSMIKEDTTEVIIPAYEGEMGILKDHIPLITFLSCLLYTSPSPRDVEESRMPSSA